MNKNITKQGFTIIEVVLVLAIAGLIFLMVFVAFPALQRNQRDARRQQDMSLMVSAVEQYRINHDKTIYESVKNTTVQCYPASSNAAVEKAVFNPSTYSGSNKACEFIANYLNSNTSTVNEFKDPNGLAYGVTLAKIKNSGNYNTSSLTPEMFYIYRKGKCSGEGVAVSANANDYAVLLKLESGSNICRDNSAD